MYDINRELNRPENTVSWLVTYPGLSVRTTFSPASTRP
jgi:hypothetical protein